MANAKQSAAWKREAKKKEAKKQGVAVAISTKKKAPVKRVKKEVSPEDTFLKEFKKNNPVGGVYFVQYVGPVRLTKVQKCTGSTVMATLVSVDADPTDGSVIERTRNVTKSHSEQAYLNLTKFDIKKFLKEINALYKKVYLS